jgi:hypothetical protein
VSADTAALESLHDIVVPGPAPWWPLAPGWYWLIGFLVVLTAVVLWRALVHWQRNCYRREALAELARIEAQIESAAIADQARDTSRYSVLPAMAELLKRTALTAYPREQVAALTGPAWFAFLDQTGGTQFSDGLGAALAHGNYFTGDALTPDSLAHETEYTPQCSADIAREIRRWIKQHSYVEAAQPARHRLDSNSPPARNSSAVKAS